MTVGVSGLAVVAADAVSPRTLNARTVASISNRIVLRAHASSRRLAADPVLKIARHILVRSTTRECVRLTV